MTFLWGRLHETRLEDPGLHCASPLDCLNEGLRSNQMLHGPLLAHRVNTVSYPGA